MPSEEVPRTPPPPLPPAGSLEGLVFPSPRALHPGAHRWQSATPPPGFWWAGRPGEAAMLVLLDSRGLANWGAARLVTAPPPSTWLWCVLPLSCQPVVPRRPGKVVPCCLRLAKKVGGSRRKVEFGFSGNAAENVPLPARKMLGQGAARRGEVQKPPQNPQKRVKTTSPYM